MTLVELVLERVVVVIPLWMSLAVHEWAHAWAADRLGDDTARLSGRLTLDPTRHLDWLGTVALPLLGIPFGWARPVPIQPTRLRGVSMAVGVALTAAAGPASNVAVALACVVVSRTLSAVGWDDPAVRWLLGVLVPLNLGLAVVNLLPVPPLDGSRVVDALIPYGWRDTWQAVSDTGPWLLVAGLVALELAGVGPLGAIARGSRAILGAG